MSEQELVTSGGGAPDKELQNLEVTTEDVATEQTEQVAEQSDEQSEEPEFVSREDFRALQSKLDKRIAELQKENERLRAMKQEQEGPSAEEELYYESILQEYERAQRVAAETKDENERLAAIYELGRLQPQLMMAEAVLIAREVGIDPNNEEYQAALMTEDIQSGNDILRIAWRTKAMTADSTRAESAVAEREERLQSATMNFEERVQQEVAKQIAALRQEMGLNATVGVLPGGGVNDIDRQIQEAKQQGDMLKVLELKRLQATK